MVGTGKKKIEIKRKEKKEQRMVTFSKRRQGLFKKAHQLHSLTGVHVAVLAFSPAAGRPYTTHTGNASSSSFDAIIERYLNATSSNGENEKNSQCLGNGEWLLRRWLEAVQVEAEGGCNSVEELVLLKEKVEEVRGKVADQIETEFLRSFLVN